MDSIAGIIRDCKKCKLHKTRTNTVPGMGSPDSSVVFVGEAPGQWEDLKGLPFVGRAGRLLDEVLESFGIARSSVFITNIVKCRPPGNRRPEKDEVEVCTGYLDRQIEAVSPKVIAPLGATAGEYICRKYGVPWTAMMKENAQAKQINTIFGVLTIVPVIHPAAVLRNINNKHLLESAIEKISGLI